MKKAYKQLRKKLSKKYKHNPYTTYSLTGCVMDWVKQSGIKANGKHLAVLCVIHGSIPYPYQKKDRKKIIKYLKNNKTLNLV
jgi:hypothetical protein